MKTVPINENFLKLEEEYNQWVDAFPLFGVKERTVWTRRLKLHTDPQHYRTIPTLVFRPTRGNDFRCSSRFAFLQPSSRFYTPWSPL